LTNPDDIKNIVKKIKERRNEWKLSPRRKNIQTLSELGLVESLVFDIIYEKISWTNYSSGPESDNHSNPIPGDIWIFGLNISNTNCYLKFQDRPNGIVMWISLHKQERPLNFPFK